MKSQYAAMLLMHGQALALLNTMRMPFVFTLSKRRMRL